MAQITDHNDFSDMKALRRAARDPRVREIEGGGLDDGRVFLHLKSGYVFGGYQSASKSVGDAREIEDALSIIVKRAG